MVPRKLLTLFNKNSNHFISLQLLSLENPRASPCGNSCGVVGRQRLDCPQALDGEEMVAAVGSAREQVPDVSREPEGWPPAFSPACPCHLECSHHVRQP